MEQCLFCKIIKKEIPSFIVKEDENFIAFLDISQMSKGHTLVLPKLHTENIMAENYPEIDQQAYQTFIYETTKMIEKKLNPCGFNLLTNHGKGANQQIFHLHTHIIPQYEEHGYTWVKDPAPKDEAYLKEVFSILCS